MQNRNSTGRKGFRFCFAAFNIAQRLKIWCRNLLEIHYRFHHYIVISISSLCGQLKRVLHFVKAFKSMTDHLRNIW